MSKNELFVMYFCTALTICIMYAPQPLQPYFEQILNISKFKASCFTTAILAPLAFSSIFYGFLLEKISIKKTLIFAFFTFGVLEFCFAISSNYSVMLTIRILQGFIAPVALTGLVSFISQNSAPENVAKAVSAYIGITIAGGFLGRFISGVLFDFFGWRLFFFVLAFCAFVAVFLLLKVSGDAVSKFAKPNFKKVLQIFEIRHNFYVFLSIFGIYFTFQGVSNILPFELLNISGNFSGSKTGIMYFGYIIGVLVAFNATKISQKFRGETNAILVGSAIFLLSLQILRLESEIFIFIAMLIFCLGSFMAHSISSAFINRKALSHKAICNGLYISFYYTGGTLGSFVPGYFYENGGWGVFLSVLSGMICLSIFSIWKLKNYELKKRKILS